MPLSTSLSTGGWDRTALRSDSAAISNPSMSRTSAPASSRMASPMPSSYGPAASGRAARIALTAFPTALSSDLSMSGRIAVSTSAVALSRRTPSAHTPIRPSRVLTTDILLAPSYCFGR